MPRAGSEPCAGTARTYADAHGTADSELWYAHSPDEVAAALEVNPAVGLSSERAARALRENGPNALPEEAPVRAGPARRPRPRPPRHFLRSDVRLAGLLHSRPGRRRPRTEAADSRVGSPHRSGGTRAPRVVGRPPPGRHCTARRPGSGTAPLTRGG
ncbi:cation-transporting P-type ATPase [Streptomyces poonensis]|uniref:cation-transporting P-type ATPase n=1 Tax=Streptomyces poonensis TaxID=68255 RepID=UPI001672CCCA|nr:cation-transporting P-type ATPase [Streptomyces poonensis]